MNDVDKSLLDFIQIFDQLGIKYAVMGGIAVRAHSIPRATHDVDVTISVSDEQLSRLIQAAETAGYTVPEAYQKGWVDRVADMPMIKFRVYLERNSVDVDIFLADSEYQKELLNRSRVEPTELGPMSVVTAEDLILLKVLADRPRDRIDVADILFTQGTLDEAYMRKWAGELGISEKLEEALANHPGDERP